MAALAAGTVWICTLEAWAGTPQLGQIMPRGAARGTEVEVVFSGQRMAEPTGFLFHAGGVEVQSIEPVNARQVKAVLRIAEDAPLGGQSVRVVTVLGVSNPRLFSIGALTEMAEPEPNDDIESAPEVPLGVTINGTITNEDVDYFAIECEAGTRLAVEIEAMRLGGRLFDPKLWLYGPEGHELLNEDDTPLLRQDAAFVYEVEEAGRYVVGVSEAAYGGRNDFYYRLHIGSFPRPLSASPLGGMPGNETEVTWLGDAAAPPATVAIDPEASGTIAVFAENDHGVAPSPQPFRAVPYPSVLEAEPNNARDNATEARAPGAFEGVIDPPGDIDWFTFEGKEGEVYDIHVWARRLGSPLDSVLQVRKPDGSNLGSNVDMYGVDSGVRVTLPEDGQYYVSIRDHLRRGGPTFAYRIEVTPVTPRLALRLVNNDTAQVTVHRGSHAFALIGITRDDFDGPTELVWPDLPGGITVDGQAARPGQGTVPVVFAAESEAPLEGALVPLTARATLDDESTVDGQLEHETVYIYGANRTIFHAETFDTFALATGGAAPFQIEAAVPQVPIVRNGSMELVVRATRDEEFSGEINLSVPWTPPGITAGSAKIAEDGTEARIQLEASGNAAIGVHGIPVVARAQNYEISTPFVPLEVEAPWVAFGLPESETEQGQPIEYRVAVEVSQGFEGQFDAVLYGLPRGVESTPQPVSAETGELVFPLTVAEDAPPDATKTWAYTAR
jgi:hypothetical protein